jgi:hypothetical protein
MQEVAPARLSWGTFIATQFLSITAQGGAAHKNTFQSGPDFNIVTKKRSGDQAQA